MGNSLILTVTGDLFQTDDISWRAFPSTDTNVVIDYGDGTTEDYGLDRDYFSHYFTDGLSEHTVTISNITGIEQEIFYNNTSITSAIIPSSVTSMGQGVFDYCTNLESITFESSTPPTIENRLLNGYNNNFVIRVPQGSLSAYTSASNYPSSEDVTYVEYTPQNSSGNQQGQGTGGEQGQSQGSNGNGSAASLYEHLRTLHKQWFYDKTEMTTSYVQKSDTTGLLKNDGTVDENTYLTSNDISGLIDSSNLSAVATSGSYSNLTDIPSTFTPNEHSHDADEITDNSAYSNINTSANATQDVINSAIDSKIGALVGTDLIEVTDNKGTASASTMNKLYFVPEATAETNDAYEVFVTVCTGTSPNYTYAWEKIDATRINISSLASINHVHGNIANAGTVGTESDYFVYTTTGGTVTSKASIGQIDTSGAIGSTADKVAVTTTDGEVTVSDWYQELDGLVIDLIAEGLSQEQQNGGE